jgi:hypothetical protein
MPKTDKQKANWRRARARNQAFIAEVNARTVCAHCGAQPIEWHNPEHVELNREHYRISVMVSQGRAIATLEAELTRCTPLCRRCHMREDGRLRQFVQASGARLPTGTILPMKPCTQCSKPYKPLRRGLCEACDSRRRYYLKTESGENRGAARRRAWRTEAAS